MLSASNHRTRSSLASVPLAIAICALLAACGSSAGAQGGGSGTSPASASTPQQSTDAAGQSTASAAPQSSGGASGATETSGSDSSAMTGSVSPSSSGATSPNAMLPEDIRSRGTIKVASSIGYAPYEMYAPDNTTFIGIDIDLIHALEPVMGVKLDISDVRYPNILPSLQAGRFDIGWSAYEEQPENEKLLDFVSYLRGGAGMLVSASNNDLMTKQPLTLCGKSVAIVAGETESLPFIAETTNQCKAQGKPGLETKSFQRTADSLLAIESGQVDVRTAGEANGVYVAKNSKGKLKFVPTIWPDQPQTTSGIAVLKGHDQLVKALQAGMQQLVDNGEYAKIFKKWGIEDDQLTKITIVTS